MKKRKVKEYCKKCIGKQDKCFKQQVKLEMQKLKLMALFK